MATTKVPLEFESYYHVYNRGINRCDLFREANDYRHFLKLYEKYIEPIANTFVWVLMPNHFHLLIRIKSEKEVLKPDRLDVQDASKPVRLKTPHQYFSNLFNAYSKYINKKYQRTGSLFERPFKRKLVEDETYLRTLVLYIHNNPIHHGFTGIALDYPWSSYLSCLSEKPTKLLKKEVVAWFDDEANFKYMHKQHVDFIKLEEWLEI